MLFHTVAGETALRHVRGLYKHSEIKHFCVEMIWKLLVTSKSTKLYFINGGGVKLVIFHFPPTPPMGGNGNANTISIRLLFGNVIL